MRTLRNPVALIAAIACAVFADGAMATGAPSAKAGNGYFPLAVGYAWTYRCSVEGRKQFDKTVRVTAVVTRDDTRYYRVEQRIGRDPKPLVYYLATGADGTVYSTLTPGSGERELLITAAPKVGDKVGARKVAARERMNVPALGQVETLRVENFSADDPAMSAEKRAEWQGRFFARDVGQVAEADGAGGDCVLSRFQRAKD